MTPGQIDASSRQMGTMVRSGGRLLRFVKNAALVLAGVVLFLGLLAYSQGAMMVYVREKKTHGVPVFLPIPALLVTEGVSFIPPDEFRRTSRDLYQWLPAIRAASGELEHVPDSVLVEVNSSSGHVLISKRGDDLVINVDDDTETVRVSLPIQSVSSIAERLATDQPPI